MLGNRMFYFIAYIKPKKKFRNSAGLIVSPFGLNYNGTKTYTCFYLLVSGLIRFSVFG